jgi:hypothetical protein
MEKSVYYIVNCELAVLQMTNFGLNLESRHAESISCVNQVNRLLLPAYIVQAVAVDVTKICPKDDMINTRNFHWVGNVV